MERNFTPVQLAYNKYEPEGSDGSTPVIFLHGMSASKEHWGDIPKTVANKTKRKVYAYDARNHGDSEWSNEFFFDDNADDLFHFLDTMGERKAILVGHSMGGVTVMKAALKKPERIEKIIVEDATTERVSSELAATFSTFFTYMQKVVQLIPPEMGEEEAKKFCGEEFPKILPKEISELAKNQTGEEQKNPQYHFALKRDSSGGYTNKANFNVLSKALKNFGNLDWELAGRFDGEAHFIYGTISILNVFEDADEIRKHFPKVEFTAVEQASHDVHEDRPEEFMDALLKSLS